MSEPEVDVVIAVHTAQRPIHRAVSSVLTGTTSSVRVTVVCHGIDPGTIASNLGELAADSRVRTLALDDGIPSPAGPFNLGLDAATAPFTTVMGSDDELEQGAMDSWLALQSADASDIVIPRLTFASGSSIRSPQTRPFRSHRLDGVKDRLAYRTAQLGLVSRTRFPTLRFTTGLRSGEDIEYGLRLWFSGATISFDRRGPAYVIHDESSDRTSISTKKTSEDFAFLTAALDPGWSATLSAHQREAIAVKLLRTQVMDALSSRFRNGPVSVTEKKALAEVVERIIAYAPAAPHIVSRRDGWILQDVLDGAWDDIRLAAELALRTDFRRPDNLLSSSSGKLLHREAPLRFLTALFFTP